jgi:predicted nucleic acid-binding protein
MKAGDTILFDANVLLSATDAARKDSNSALGLFRSVPAAGIHIAVCAQILREYLVVATRPENANGAGLSVEDALHNIRFFRSRALVAGEDTRVLDTLVELVRTHERTGKSIHDVNIAALMIVQEIPYIVTANTQDFRDFEGLTPIGIEALADHLANIPTIT